MLGDFVDEGLNVTLEKDIQQLGDLLADCVRHNVEDRVLRILEKELKKEMRAYVHLLKGLLLLSVNEKLSPAQFAKALEELHEDNMSLKLLPEDQKADYTAKVVEFRANLVRFMEGKNMKRKPVRYSFLSIEL